MAARAGSLTARVAAHPRALLLLSALVLFAFWPRGSSLAGCPSVGTRYGIMMDAGSTGSRTHIFEFDFKADGTKRLVREEFYQTKPGLSSFGDDAEGAARSLIPLMEHAVRDVPKEHAACTPVMLKATAGLRLLGEAKSANILSAVEAMLGRYHFFVPPGAAVVMDGRDEGPYAWLTVNFLLGTLFGPAEGRGKTAAILDMGGASTQIVFVPDDPSTLASAPMDHVFEVSLPGTKVFRMYTHSHLGLGLKEAGKAISKLAPEGQPFPCQSATPRDTTLSFDACLPYAERVLGKRDTCHRSPCSFKGAYQPRIRDVFTGDVYVASYFYDRMEHFMTHTEPANSTTVGGTSTVGDFKTVGSKICAGREEPFASHNHGSMCLDLTYLYAILSRGYEMPDDLTLHLKKKIDGVETAWALGAMILNMN